MPAGQNYILCTMAEIFVILICPAMPLIRGGVRGHNTRHNNNNIYITAKCSMVGLQEHVINLLRHTFQSLSHINHDRDICFIGWYLFHI